MIKENRYRSNSKTLDSIYELCFFQSSFSETSEIIPINLEYAQTDKCLGHLILQILFEINQKNMFDRKYIMALLKASIIRCFFSEYPFQELK